MSIYKQKEIIKKKLKMMFLENQDLQKAIFYPVKSYKSENPLDDPYILFEANPSLGIDNSKIIPKIYFSNRIIDVIEDYGVKILISVFERPMSGRINSMKLSVVFTILIHNNALITEYSDSRFDEICEMIDKRIGGNYWVSDGFRMINKGIRVLNTQKEYDGINLIYETIITHTHNYGKFKESDKFDI